ncbi:hypothetical protein KIN20_015569 [Parelaphostrongylus tenuis]|uniref:Uncharacterized protein n=1 Tax=Parelaphostrongylus tenuis TaxID=148309 RepID=A0AAD5MGA5_PARTN|nr:hypothetical protein KIN20_015569 [Parelaphostrongylus tenuis]
MTNLVHARMATKMTNPVHIPWAAKGWWYTNRMPFTDGNDYKDDDQKDVRKDESRLKINKFYKVALTSMQ